MNIRFLAESAISLMPPKAVTGWFAVSTDGQLWGVTTMAYFRPEAAVQVRGREQQGQTLDPLALPPLPPSCGSGS